MQPIRILIIDDHAVVRSGLRSLLEDEAHIDIVGEAADGLEALAKIEELQPDILLLDLTMPQMSGFEVAKKVTEKYSAVKIIVFSMHNDHEYIMRSVEMGAQGYLLKDTSKEEILRALTTVANGSKYFSPEVAAQIIDQLLSERQQNTANNKPTSATLSVLSKQEKVILNYIVEGMNSQEIAEKLDLSVRTVSNHRANILKKTKVKNTAELVRLAVG